MPRRRIKKGEPEMLIVSFCDIVTVVTAALFFALLITIQEALKIPVFKPTPRAVPTNKTPVFFECRNHEVFYVNKDALDSQVAKKLSQMNPGVRSGDLSQFLKAIQGEEIGNQDYSVDPKYLLVGVMALQPKPGSKGEAVTQLQAPSGLFQSALAQLDKQSQYIAFLVRDDSFDAFRTARSVADKIGYDTGWELLGEDEPIKFGQGGASIAPQ